jgi:predicted nucleic acid-binding Zn ribbon protein
MSDLPLEQCPVCGKNTLKKLMSAAAFHLKGTGWYETDFSGKKKPEEDTPKTDTAKTDTQKTETKKTDTTKTDNKGGGKANTNTTAAAA